jgi:hypothetical protein
MSRLLDVSKTERIDVGKKSPEDLKLLGEDKRLCDVCKTTPAEEKVLRTNGFISINQFLCGQCLHTLKLNEVAGESTGNRRVSFVD